MAKNRMKLRAQKRMIAYLTLLSAHLMGNYAVNSEAHELPITEETMMEYFDNFEEVMQSIDATNEVAEEYEAIVQESNSTLAEEVRKSEYNVYLKQYSYYFNFDEEKVLEAAQKMTNNYTNDFQIEIGKSGIYYGIEDPETFAMIFVCSLYRNEISEEYHRDDFLLSDELVPITRDENGDIVLQNGSSFSIFLGRTCDMLSAKEDFKALALAISNSETQSQSATVESLEKGNNPGGLRNADGFFTFPSLEAGIIYFAMNLKRIEGIHGEEIDSFEELSALYVNGKVDGKPAPIWIKNVSWFYYQIVDNMDSYFIIEQKPMILEYTRP